MMMTRICIPYVALLFISILGSPFCFGLKAFDDTVLFKMNWLAKTGADFLDSEANAEPYTIISSNNEKYQCFIPETTQEEVVQEQEYTGPTPMEFLSLLFNQNTCSYRLESYWTYELCHGRYVQQYHEERDGKKVRVQKYELGKFDQPKLKKLLTKYEELAKDPNKKSEIPMKKIDGINMPYVEVEMTDGTLCDLNDKPRSIRVLYVCFQRGKQEILSIKETSICEYETIVLTPLLCGHPDYKPQETEENKINCRPLGNAPKKPKSLLALEAERMKLLQQKVPDDEPQKVYAIFRVDKDGQDGHPQVRVEILPVDSSSLQNAFDDPLNQLIDSQENNVAKGSSVENFLSGRNCLNGGNGWWKYEFCYGRSVNQYHIESEGTKTVVSLGEFKKEKHMEWIKANRNKQPKPISERKQISHFYSDGTFCDQTGKPRQTEVKLKCVRNSGSPSSVSLYLLEPKSCEYVLGVESPLICNILEHADDEYGIINDKFLLNLEDTKTNLQSINKDNDERIANGDE